MKLREFYALFISRKKLSRQDYEAVLKLCVAEIYFQSYKGISKRYVNYEDIIHDVAALRYQALDRAQKNISYLIKAAEPINAQMEKLRDYVEEMDAHISVLTKDLKGLKFYQIFKKSKLNKQIKQLDDDFEVRELIDYLVWQFVTADKSGSREEFNQLAEEYTSKTAAELNDKYIKILNCN